MKKFAFPRSIASVPFDELKAFSRDHLIPVNLQAAKRVKYRSFGTEFILTLQTQASEYNFGDHLEIQLREWLFESVNHSPVQKKILVKQEQTFAEAQEICKLSDDLPDVTAEHSVVFSQDPIPSSR